MRELENTVERVAVLCTSDRVEPGDLSPAIRGEQERITPTMDLPDRGVCFREAVDAFENALILQALEKTGWNKNRAARLLRLNRTTLVEKIKKKQLKKGGSPCTNTSIS
ncbi:MAG: hypothetical protein HY543_01395 [Deltaproteobacteria bacterium]|nr:hypothetical protein [Deltaproteobacteria bacterium]